MTASGPPALAGILETVLYCTPENEDATRRFYAELLGLKRLGEDSFAYRVGGAGHVFLLFDSEESRSQESPPAHGATGPVHVCFLTSPEDYDAWKEYLGSRGVTVTDEIDWGNGRHSLYFEDPAGNLLEIADGDIWPT